MWNAPTELCETRYEVTLDLRPFEIIGSPMKSARGQNLTIFYHDRLGYYPYYDEITGQSFNGGLPQMAPQSRHYSKTVEDIEYYIPSDETPGIAVIDWENWRPQWVRNWSLKTIYRRKSIELVKQRDPSLTTDHVKIRAIAEFEDQAKSFMLNTLRLGKILRPNCLWGYFLYPDCYNYKVLTKNYTGRCFAIEISRNDELFWLWKESTALFPSIYLHRMQSSAVAAKFVRHRVQEAKRAAALSGREYSLPVYVYTRPVFTTRPDKYLSEVDLVHTIGESAALGTAGFAVWGDLDLSKSLHSCVTLADYLTNLLNPYVINVTLAAKLCSRIVCRNKGRCVRKNWDSGYYLHLNPENFRISSKKEGITVKGQASFEDILFMSERFTCQCYPGQTCEPIRNIENHIMEHNTCINSTNCNKF
eukprot:gi/632961621/ref/XP_007896856.1/ PREDICTED: hyaluronidase PH-20-like [Callorhinchus milii]